MPARLMLDVLWHHLDEESREDFLEPEVRSQRDIGVLLAAGGEVG